MHGDFWAGALRDFALLVAGGLLTFAGGWISNRAAAKREREARLSGEQSAAAARDRAAIERVRSLVFDLYLEGREWEERGESREVRFNERTFRDAELSAELISDSGLRTRLRQAFFIANNPQRSVLGQTRAHAGVYTRVSAMRIAVAVLSSSLRGDGMGERHERFLERQAYFALQRATR